MSDDPKEVVNGIALGPTVLKILVQIPIKPDMFLFRPATNMSFIKEARGKAIAWPADRVIQQFIEESEEEQNYNFSPSVRFFFAVYVSHV